MSVITTKFDFNPFTGTLDIVAGSVTVDRLTSEVGAGSTLILTDDSSDQTLTGNLGDLIITPTGEITCNAQVTAEKFLSEYTTAAVSHDSADFGVNIASTSPADFATYRSLYLDYDYGYNNAVGNSFSTHTGLEIAYNVTTTAGAFVGGTYRPVKITATFDSSTNPGGPLFDLQATMPGTTSGTGSQGALFAKVTALNTTSTVTGCRTEVSVKSASATSTSVASGYTGYAEGNNTFTGRIIGVYGIAAQVTNADVCIGGLFDAAATGALSNKENQLAVKGTAGHALFNKGSLFITNDGSLGTSAGCSGLATKPDKWTSTAWGNAYISGALETDGVTWMDGGWGTNYTDIDNTDSPYSVTANDLAIYCDCSSGAITVNLPAIASNDQRMIQIKKIDSSGNAVTIDGNGSETIDGSLTQSISSQYESLTLHCTSTEWRIW